MRIKILLIILFMLNCTILKSQNPTKAFVIPFNIDKHKIYQKVHDLKKDLQSKKYFYLEYILNEDLKNKIKDEYLDEELDKLYYPEEKFKEIKIILKVDSIKIIKQNAFLKCNITFYDNDRIISTFSDLLELEKSNGWKFKNLSNLLYFVHKIYKKSNTESTPFEYNEVQINLSDRTLIPYPFTGSTYDLGYSLTNQYLNVQLYAEGAYLDGTMYVNAVSGSDLDETAFTLDPYWRRIVYARDNYGTFSTIESYSDHPSDICKFLKPVAIDVNALGEIFVVDFEAVKIFKLQYIPSSNSIQCTTTNSFIDPNYLSEPVDISYNSRLTPYNTSDDYIVVTDIGRKSILYFDINGNFIRECDQYTFGYGNYYPIQKPIRLITIGDHIQWVDGEENVVFAGGYLFGNAINVFNPNPARLPYNSTPTDIGINACNNLVVSDTRLNMLHIFDFYGSYICSYDGTGSPISFVNPKRVSNDIHSIPYSTRLDFKTEDDWSASHGFKRFLPGADAVQFKIKEQDTYLKFSCVITDAGPYTVTLYNSANQQVFTESGNAFWGGELYETLISKSSLSSGTYRWNVTTTPENDNLYGSYAVGPRYRNFYFDFQETLPSSITTSTTISGLVYCDGLTISNNATVTINPGTIIYINPDKNITVENGSKIIAVGDDNFRITFKQASPGDKWGNINLYGDGNQFKYCIFNGGYYGAYIRSGDNSFSNCKFNNNYQGIKTYTHVQGGWSDFELTECFFINNSYGVNASYTYGSINNCTIRESSYDGLYLYNARIGNDIGKVFFNNYISSNGRYGINLQHNGKLWLGYNWMLGNNKIYNNDSHEVYLVSSTSARLYDSDNGGYSYIYDMPSSMYIYNLAQTFDGEFYTSWTVSAENNYWGDPEGPLDPQDNFYGPVDYNPFLDDDPTNDPGAHYYPDKVSGKEPVLTVVEGNIIESPIGGKGPLTLLQRMQNIRNLIKNNPFNIFNGSHLNNLYSLLDYDPDNSLRQQRLILELIDENITRLRNLSRQPTIPGPDTVKAIQLIVRRQWF